VSAGCEIRSSGSTTTGTLLTQRVATLSCDPSVAGGDRTSEPNQLSDQQQWLNQYERLTLSRRPSRAQRADLADVEYPATAGNRRSRLLYVSGRRSSLSSPALAVVGSRNATPQGLKNAQSFARTFSEAAWSS